MKKFAIVIITCIFILTITTIPFSATQNLQIETTDIREDLMIRLGEISYRKYLILAENNIDHIAYMNLIASEEYINVNLKEGGYIAELYILNQEKAILEQELSMLGTIKLTKENLDNYSDFFQDVFSEAYTEDIYDTAPDLEAYADLYSIYIYDFSTEYNDITYYGRQIQVHPDSYYTALAERERNLAMGSEERAINSANAILDFAYASVSYAVGATLTALNPILSEIWQVVDFFAPDELHLLQTTAEISYDIIVDSVTHMSYYYIYDSISGIWRMVAADAYIMMAEYHEVYFYNNGAPDKVEELREYVLYTSNWPRTLYLERYVDMRPILVDYSTIQAPGSFGITGYNNATASFTPKFARTLSMLWAG